MLKKEAEKQKEKRLARAAIKRRLSTITEEENREAGQAMLTYLRQSNAYRMARVVFCFVSTKKEPDTTPFLQQVLNDGKRLCVPLCVGKGQMEAREITSLDQLKPGLFGILEPKEDTPLVSEKDIDFCAAPCLAAAKDGTRIGHGGGYYDRFMPKLSSRCYCVVLCNEKMLCETLPAGKTDYRFHRIITQSGMVRVEQREENEQTSAQD